VTVAATPSVRATAAGLVLFTLASGQFLMTLDSSVMNVSIATVAKDVGTTVTGIQGAITAYTLVMAALMIIGAKVGAMIGRKRAFAIGCRRGVPVRLFAPADANNWACAAAQRFHHAKLLDAGVRILEYPTMLHAKAFVRDGEEVLAGTCNLEAWSLKRLFEIDLLVRSEALAAQFEERFATPAEMASSPGIAVDGLKSRAKATAFAALSPLL
jgi:phosphatidylserine/phosphatidylglycerophosphate/cardiolipin synthase-like enzyme